MITNASRTYFDSRVTNTYGTRLEIVLVLRLVIVKDKRNSNNTRYHIASFSCIFHLLISAFPYLCSNKKSSIEILQSLFNVDESSPHGNQCSDHFSFSWPPTRTSWANLLFRNSKASIAILSELLLLLWSETR